MEELFNKFTSSAQILRKIVEFIKIHHVIRSAYEHILLLELFPLLKLFSKLVHYFEAFYFNFTPKLPDTLINLLFDV